MDVSALQHGLTSDERAQFDRGGYLIVEDALPPELNQRLEQVVDRLHADGWLSQAGIKLGVRGRVHHPDFLSLDEAFIDLVDHERTFPKVWDILGWNIYIYDRHLGVTERVDGAYDPRTQRCTFIRIHSRPAATCPRPTGRRGCRLRSATCSPTRSLNAPSRSSRATAAAPLTSSWSL